MMRVGGVRRAPQRRERAGAAFNRAIAESPCAGRQLRMPRRQAPHAAHAMEVDLAVAAVRSLMRLELKAGRSADRRRFDMADGNRLAGFHGWTGGVRSEEHTSELQ